VAAPVGRRSYVFLQMGMLVLPAVLLGAVWLYGMLTWFAFTHD
jgi:hypothetical protein